VLIALLPFAGQPQAAAFFKNFIKFFILKAFLSKVTVHVTFVCYDTVTRLNNTRFLPSHP
jgi:hypothetical protein